MTDRTLCKLGVERNHDDKVILGIAFFLKHTIYFDMGNNDIYLGPGREISFWNLVDISLLTTDIILFGGLIGLILFFGIRKVRRDKRHKPRQDSDQGAPEEEEPKDAINASYEIMTD